MPIWRCPHCGTPQAETARCWVCRRSSTACATCRNFRRSVAAQLGYCGLDRERRPLRGNEIRGCWEAAPAFVEAPSDGAPLPARVPLHVVLDRTPVRKLEFVEVGASPPPVRGRRRTPSDAASAGAGDGDGPAAPEPSMAINPGEPGWNLWGETEV